MVQIAEIAIVESVLSRLLDEKLGALKLNKANSPEYDFVSDRTARCILAGGDKPLSKPTFNKLRKEKGVRTYHSSENRVLFSRAELHAIIAGSK